MKDRAYRRAVAEKLIVKRSRRRFVVDRFGRMDFDLINARPRHYQMCKIGEMPLQRFLADTATPCSCWLCCNRRKWGEKTLAERRADFDFQQQLAEARRPKEEVEKERYYEERNRRVEMYDRNFEEVWWGNWLWDHGYTPEEPMRVPFLEARAAWA
jgi:hypothetical protein